MNTISINSTSNVGVFEPPRFQDLHLILKSLPMFKDDGLQVGLNDTFTWDKEDGKYILLHYNEKFDKEKAIFVVDEHTLKTANMKVLHQHIIDLVHYAWCEYLF